MLCLSDNTSKPDEHYNLNTDPVMVERSSKLCSPRCDANLYSFVTRHAHRHSQFRRDLLSSCVRRSHHAAEARSNTTTEDFSLPCLHRAKGRGWEYFPPSCALHLCCAPTSCFNFDQIACMCSLLFFTLVCLSRTLRTAIKPSPRQPPHRYLV